MSPLDKSDNVWYYKDNPFDDVPKGYYGFVYLIEDLKNSRKYIGKKFFWQRKVKTVNKKKKRILAESNWKDYFGSNSNLNEEVKKHGVAFFRRTILHLCKTKSECAYLETYEQFKRNVLLSEEYYNDWVSCKITRTHLKSNLKHIQENIDAKT